MYLFLILGRQKEVQSQKSETIAPQGIQPGGENLCTFLQKGAEKVVRSQTLQPQGFDGCCTVCTSFFKKVYYSIHFNTPECIITRGRPGYKKKRHKRYKQKSQLFRLFPIPACIIRSPQAVPRSSPRRVLPGGGRLTYLLRRFAAAESSPACTCRDTPLHPPSPASSPTPGAGGRRKRPSGPLQAPGGRSGARQPAQATNRPRDEGGQGAGGAVLGGPAATGRRRAEASPQRRGGRAVRPTRSSPRASPRTECPGGTGAGA